MGIRSTALHGAKIAAEWVLPPAFQRLARRVRSGWQLLRSPDAVLAKNSPLRNREQGGRRCFILATGPSVKRQDLTLLKGETVIAVSNSYLHPLYGEFAPAYHNIPKLCYPPLTTEKGVEWLRDMEAKTGRATMFFSAGDRSTIEANGLFKGREVHYLWWAREWDPTGQREIDIARPLPYIASSPVMSLQIALYLGFSKIYLLGCDHDWILHMGVSSHFYEEKEHAVTDKVNEWIFGFEKQVQFYGILWAQYQAIREYARRRSVEIYNATDGGLLEVFPRAEFRSLFSQPNNAVQRGG